MVRSFYLRANLLAFALLTACAHAQGSSAFSAESPEVFAERKLVNAGLPRSLIDEAKQCYKTKQRDDIILLNLLGFLQRADYSGHYSALGIKKSRQLLRDYRNSFRMAEKRFGVAASDLAALIWVESKVGKVLGTYPLASVYFSLAEAEHPDMIELAEKRALELRPDLKNVGELREQIRRRAKQKSDLAIDELKAMLLVRQPHREKNLRGSFAGAFGIPQFVPSSYVKWAKSVRANKSPNLFLMPDAILSVANYLHENGWKQDDLAAKRAALFHYNRSDGYVDVILKLGEELRKKP